MTPPAPDPPGTRTHAPDSSGADTDPDVDALVALCRLWEDARLAGEPVSADALCAARPDLLPDLLRAIDVLGALDSGARSTAADPAADARPPRLPGYEVLGEIGRGGMGAVYSARHLALNRVVAVKVLADAGASATRLARFRQEAEAVARLQHPNIVQVFEVGSADGRPFLALEYVDGGTLRARAAGVPQPPRDAARVVETVARAVHHAHAAGIVHRDLKPANILLTAGGVPKVADFGLARALDAAAGLTVTADFLGTPAYAAPEQVHNRAADIGPATDVYGLGATLYELLAGRPPFDPASLPELLRQVTDDDPTPLRRLRPDLPRDLETVCHKCLDKVPARRYPSALALADDLRRFLADEPVLARPVGPLGRVRRWAKRNPAVAVLLAAIGLVLTAAAVTGAVLASSRAVALRDAEQARDRALRAEREGQRKLFAAYISEANAIRASGQPGQRFLALDKIRQAMALDAVELTAADRLAARNAAAAALCQPDLCPGSDWVGTPPAGGVPPEIRAYAQAVQFRPPDGTVPEPVRVVSPTGRFAVVAPRAWVPQHDNPFELWRIDGSEPARVLVGAVAVKQNAVVAFSPDERKVAVARSDGTVVVSATAGGDELTRFPAGSSRVWRLVWHPDGEKLAVALGDETGPANEQQVWDTAATPPTVWATVRHLMATGGVAFHPTGRVLATAGADEFLRLWELPGGRPIAGWRTSLGGGSALAFDHDGGLIVGSDWGGTQRVWDAGTGRELARLMSGNGSLGFAHDGRSGAPSLHAGWYYDSRLAGGRERWALNRPAADGFEPVAWVAPHPAGRLLAVSSADRVALVDLATGRPVAAVPCATHWFRFDGRGALWAYCGSGSDAPLLRWPVAADPAAPHRLTVGPPEYVGSNLVSDVYGTSADGRLAALPRRGAGAQVVRLGSPPEVRTFSPQDDVRTSTLSADGRLLATATFYTSDESGVRLKVWDVPTGRHLATVPVGQAFSATGFSPDGRWLYTEGGLTAGYRRWNLSAVGAELVPRWEATPQRPNGGASPDGRIVARQPDATGIALHDAADDRELVRLPLLGGSVRWCWSADSSRLFVIGKQDGTLYAYDLRLIRRGLAELGLDWDHPPYPPAPAWESEPAAPPLEVRTVGADAAVSPKHLAAAERARAVADLALDPLDPDARRRLGLWLLYDGRAADAYPHLATAASLAPSVPAVWPPLAEAAVRAGRWAEAAAAAERAVAADPADYRLHHLRARAEAGRGRPADAADALTAALERVVGRGERLPLLFARAAARRAAGNAPAADADVRAAEALTPGTPAIALAAVAVELATGPAVWRDPPRALALVRQAVAREPGQLHFQKLLGIVQYHNGLYKDAAATLEAWRAAAQGYADAAGLFVLAMCHHRLGDPGTARQRFDAAVRWAGQADWLGGPENTKLAEFRREAEAVLATPR